MKTVKKFQLFTLLLLSVISFNSCVESNDIDVPIIRDTPFSPQNADDIITNIGAILGEFEQQGGIYTFETPPNGQNTYISGYVISSDEGGNFFEEIVIQDRPENPTAGIVVQVDVNPLFTFYEFGRKVFIKVNGLTVAESNGVVQLGFRNGNDLEKIPSALRNEYIIRDNEFATIEPLEVSISDFSNDLESLFIRLNDVQFVREEALADSPMTLAAEPTDQFDGERTLESCADNSSVILSTSTFSDFKGLIIPTTRGSIDGVLTRDFFDDFYTLVINTPEDINFDNDVRCDPTVLDCGLASTEGTNILFEDDFETQSAFSPVSGNGWTNYIEEGSESWEAYTSGGTNASQGVSVRMSAFGTDDDSNIAWLITPPIDIDGNTGVTFSFETSNSFSDGSTLELLFSNDWDGTTAGIATATWGIVPNANIVSDSEFFGNWVSSGIVDLSCGEGSSVYFAFRYVGSDTNNDLNGTYELDNIKFAAN
jgi:hypothetical protein